MLEIQRRRFLRIALRIDDDGFMSVSPAAVGFSDRMLCVSLVVFLLLQFLIVYLHVLSRELSVTSFHAALLKGKLFLYFVFWTHEASAG